MTTTIIHPAPLGTDNRDYLREQLQLVTAERDKLALQVYAPGLWRCAKCSFTLVQASLNAADGTVTARDTPGDKCPNCGSPLWRVTERQNAQELMQLGEAAIERAIKAEAERDKMRASLRELVSYYGRIADDGFKPIEIRAL